MLSSGLIQRLWICRLDEHHCLWCVQVRLQLHLDLSAGSYCRDCVSCLTPIYVNIVQLSQYVQYLCRQSNTQTKPSSVLNNMFSSWAIRTGAPSRPDMKEKMITCVSTTCIHADQAKIILQEGTLRNYTAQKRPKMQIKQISCCQVKPKVFSPAKFKVMDDNPLCSLWIVRVRCTE